MNNALQSYNAGYSEGYYLGRRYLGPTDTHDLEAWNRGFAMGERCHKEYKRDPSALPRWQKWRTVGQSGEV